MLTCVNGNITYVLLFLGAQLGDHHVSKMAEDWVPVQCSTRVKTLSKLSLSLSTTLPYEMKTNLEFIRYMYYSSCIPWFSDAGYQFTCWPKVSCTLHTFSFVWQNRQGNWSLLHLGCGGRYQFSVFLLLPPEPKREPQATLCEGEQSQTFRG